MKKSIVADYDAWDAWDEEDELSEEELDELHRPRKMNSRKSLLPLFVYQILTANEQEHFTQDRLIRELEQYPYEIRVERKALSRALHTLADSGIGILSTTKNGAWYDSEEVW